MHRQTDCLLGLLSEQKVDAGASGPATVWGPGAVREDPELEILVSLYLTARKSPDKLFYKLLFLVERIRYNFCCTSVPPVESESRHNF